eukprot:scaffold10570_cov176-Amphora_coffeaeformis.AAC.14
MQERRSERTTWSDGRYNNTQYNIISNLQRASPHESGDAKQSGVDLVPPYVFLAPRSTCVPQFP